MTGDTTPISDEAVAAFEAVYWHEDTAKSREWPIREALAAARPLLVSAEAERAEQLRSRNHDLARELMQSAAAVEGLRAELAEAERHNTALAHEYGGLRQEFDEFDAAFSRIAEALDLDDDADFQQITDAVLALRAAGGQEKPNDAMVRAALTAVQALPDDYPDFVYGHVIKGRAEAEARVDARNMETTRGILSAALAAAPVGGQAEIKAALDAKGLPHSVGLAGLIHQERTDAALAATFDAMRAGLVGGQAEPSDPHAHRWGLRWEDSGVVQVCASESAARLVLSRLPNVELVRGGWVVQR